MAKVLIVEDDEVIGRGIAAQLTHAGFESLRRQRRRDRTVDVFVRKLRDRIHRRTTKHDFPHTRHGVGYKLEAEPKAGSVAVPTRDLFSSAEQVPRAGWIC